jgi:hypothetical protein
VDGITYFQVRLERPADLRLPAFDTTKPFSEADRRRFAMFPRLAPQDQKTRAVYYRHRPTQPGMSFCGRLLDGEKAPFLLLYPTGESLGGEGPTSLSKLVWSQGMAETAVELDFTKATMVPVPKVDPDDQHIHRDDLRALWALHQGAHLAALEAQVLDFPFYSFAREATGRKYGVVASAWVKRQTGDPQHRLYEITTGADALAESLQLHRMLQTEARPAGERTIPIADVAGVTVPEQPWADLLKNKNPTTETLAQLVPQDNYYLSFKDIRKFIDLGELLDQWGTSILRVYEMKSRDFHLRERYEKQLCLKTTALGKKLGPTLVKGLAVTGNDPYFREGTDVSVIFHVRSRELFLAAVSPLIEEARKEFGKELREQKTTHRGTTIESYATPLREVSLHRAAFDEYVVYSNSPVAVRRILDTHAGKGKSLAESQDYQYLRTVFPVNDKAEDGFVFLSDAFIRQLTGPASRIKEKRRLEALTSLNLLTNAALFGAWETGKLPADQAAVLAAAGLRPEDVAIYDGKGARWDAGSQLAVSDVYNTIHFATPLIELPIDKVTRAEEQEYDRFRDEYTKLWRTYFDPVGVRLSLEAKKVQVEMLILPLAGSEQYRSLRQLTGNGKFLVESRPGAVLDCRLSVGEGQAISFYAGGGNRLREMIELLIRWEEGGVSNPRQEYDQLFWKLPVGVGLFGPAPPGMTDGESLVKMLQQAGQLVKGEPQVSKYREVKLHKVPIDAKVYRSLWDFLPFLEQQGNLGPILSILALLPRQEAPDAIYIAGIDRGVIASASEDHVKKMIDHSLAQKKPEGKPVPREANAALDIVPGNAGEAAKLYLEYEGHCLALLNNQVFNAFYQSGLLTPDATETTRKQTVQRFLGCLPVSADGTSYRYDAKHGEVVNVRHGSHRRPQLHGAVAEASELGKLLNDIKALRAELKFLDNGIQTVLTIERK